MKKESKSLTIAPTASDILLYQTEDGHTRIDVRLEGGTVWLTQLGLAELYQVTVPNINTHLKNIFLEGELDQSAVIKEYLITASDGKHYKTKHYSLEAILAVGYRVRSHRGTQFRRWATERLSEYLAKGFVLDDERLKEGKGFGADYFDELLERIRDIRASEKRFYRKITDIYALSADYDPKAEISETFFKTVQNKLHWAVTGHTAAELIASRADSAKPNMGLTTWKRAKVRRVDVTVAKNYLSAEELTALNRIVTMYLDYAEDQANKKQPMYMRDWITKLDSFLEFNDRAVLKNAGRISQKVAETLAYEAYEKFNARRLAEEALAEDDFDRAAKRLEGKKK